MAALARAGRQSQGPGQGQAAALARVAVMLQPAARAYMLGYLLDALPTLFKQVLRYVLVNIRSIARVRKRIAQEKAAAMPGSSSSSSALGIESQGKAGQAARVEAPEVSQTSLYADGIQPALHQLPGLLKSILKSLFVALGPKGVGFACAAAMMGTAVLDEGISKLLLTGPVVATAAAGIPTPSSYLQSRRRAVSTFVSAAICSSFALYMIQREAIGDHGALKGNIGISNPFRKKGSQVLLPTPLAPGGNFLARLTSLSVPTTPGEKGSRSPSERFFSKLPAPPSLSPSDSRGSGLVTPSDPKTDPDSDELGIASPTIDLSLFALVRAMDTLVRAAPLLFVSSAFSHKGKAVGPAAGMKTDSVRNQLARTAVQARTAPHMRLLQGLFGQIRNQAEGLTFVVSCAVIMYSWFYHPKRLPPSYVKWISNLAAMDHRLLEALRCLRYNKPFYFDYSDKKTEPAGIDLLGSLAESMGHPYEWGDVSRLPHTRETAKKMMREAKASGGRTEYVLEGASGLRGKGLMGGVPCELIHCGVGGPNCYKNSLYRFLRAWKVCLGIYIPVHLLPRLIFGPGQFKREPIEAITKVLKGSMRSATFLSTFIASIWFMVCAGRTTLLPRLFPNVSHSYWDSGLGPIMGSWTCGWSVFIEEKRKRAEMALYVAPRALFALAEMAKPGWLSRGHKSALQTERVLFGMSVGIVVAAAKHRPDLLRGLTALITWVVASPRRSDGRITAAAPRS